VTPPDAGWEEWGALVLATALLFALVYVLVEIGAY